MQKKKQSKNVPQNKAVSHEGMPNRERILAVLKEVGVPLAPARLFEILNISSRQQTKVKHELTVMEQAGQILRNRKGALCVAEKLDLVVGVVEGHADGFGFLVPDAGGNDIFLSFKEMRVVMHGDRVVVQVTGTDRKGRPEGAVVEVLERRTERIVGRINHAYGVMTVRAEDKRICKDILIPPQCDMNALPGQVVTVKINHQPTQTQQPIGEVVEVLGHYTDSGIEIEIALRKYALPYEFSKAALDIAKRYAPKVSATDYAGREDRRDLALLTIDGETARDFDDAVYAAPIKAGKAWRLVVAIADVSFYVQPKEILDKEAFERGNSVYFPRRVIPMLPETLSNGLCSLNPQVDRLCMVCDMEVNLQGEVTHYRFYPSVMRSRARLTYNEVHAILQNPQGPEAKLHANLVTDLQHLQGLYSALRLARRQRGAIDFEMSETEIVFDEQGKIASILPTKRNEAHCVIEECMLAANVCAADFLSSHHRSALYRVHLGPTLEKLNALRAFLAEFGLGIGGGEKPQSKDYSKLLTALKGRTDAALLQTVMLRSMQQAVYSPNNEGHFGLAYPAYTHFTSPIRRYPDLLTHRAIKAVLAGKTDATADWQHLGKHCSMTERRADDATREVDSWLKCFYMQDKVGSEFNGTVVGVAGFGLFVALDEIYVEGLVHVTELGNDYFHYDKARHEMLGERSAKRYRLGDRLAVRVVRVSLETRKIELCLVDNSLRRKTAKTSS